MGDVASPHASEEVATTVHDMRLFVGPDIGSQRLLSVSWLAANWRAVVVWLVAGLRLVIDSRWSDVICC